MLSFQYVVVPFVIVLLSAGREDENESLDGLKKQLATLEKQAVKELVKEEIWSTSAQKGVLMEQLTAAALVRSPAIAPMLAKNITYAPSLRVSPIPTLSRMYPAYAALRNIGVPAVRSIIDELKALDADKKVTFDLSGRLSDPLLMRNLLVECLIEIYEQGGFGKELASQRIESEIKKASGAEKQRLTKLLEHPSLK